MRTPVGPRASVDRQAACRTVFCPASAATVIGVDMSMAKRAPAMASILFLLASLSVVTAEPPPAPRDIFDFGKEPPRAATRPAAATTKPVAVPAARNGPAPVLAAGIQIVADDFV